MKMEKHINSQFEGWQMMLRINKEFIMMPKGSANNINMKIQSLEPTWSEIENYHFMLFETYDEDELSRTEYVNRERFFLKWEEEYTKANLAMLKSLREIKEENEHIRTLSSVIKHESVERKMPNLSIPEIDSNRRSKVNAYIQRIMAMKECKTESASALKYLLDTTTDCLKGLTRSGVDTNNWDAIIIVYIIVNKLDSISLKKWEELLSSVNNDSLPTLTLLMEFLEDRVRTLEDLEDIKPKENVRTKKFVNSIDSKEEEDKRNDVNIVEKSVHHTHTRKEILCTYCDSEHRIYNCQRFKNMSYKEKRSFIDNKKLCFNCLAPHHRAKQCKHYIRCKFCGGKHSSLIHILSRINKGKTSPKVGRREEAFRKIQSTNEDKVLKYFARQKTFGNRENVREISNKNMRNVNRSTQEKQIYINRDLGKKQNRKFREHVHSRKKIDNVHSFRIHNTKEIENIKFDLSNCRIRDEEKKIMYSQSLLKFLDTYSKSQEQH